MKKFTISESEKERILNMHVDATKKQYLKEDLNQGMTDEDRYNYNRGIQCFLNKKEITDGDGQQLKLDGSIGRLPNSKSAQAIAKYQRTINVTPDGVWGEETMGAMSEKDKAMFKQCISDYGDLFTKIWHYFGWD
jgi:hypothetical protein